MGGGGTELAEGGTAPQGGGAPPGGGAPEGSGSCGPGVCSMVNLLDPAILAQLGPAVVLPLPSSLGRHRSVDRRGMKRHPASPWKIPER